jgi:hypothetical protein
LYAGPGTAVVGQTWVPAVPGYYSYGYVAPPGYWHVVPSVPPPLRYNPRAFSYQGNPYLPFPYSYSYEAAPYTYFPNSYTYDLRAYGYAYPPALYPAPVYPYRYYYYYYHAPRSRSGIYRPLTLREYLARQSRGPARVRDYVPGAPRPGR